MIIFKTNKKQDLQAKIMGARATFSFSDTLNSIYQYLAILGF